MFCAVIFNWFRAVGLPAALPDVFSQRVLLYLLQQQQQQQQQSNIAATCIWNDNWDRYGDVKEEPWQSIKSRMARVKILDSMMWWREREREAWACVVAHTRLHTISQSLLHLSNVYYISCFFYVMEEKKHELCIHLWLLHLCMYST